MPNYINESLKPEDRLGQIGINKKGEKMKITKYIAYNNIEVTFMDEKKCVTRTQYVNFLMGNVKNYYSITHGNHGYIGKGNYTSEHRDENGKRISHESYDVWSSMHVRAENFDGKHPSYTDVKVCEEWWNYQNFAKWYEEHKYEVPWDDFLCLDKDILFPGNRIYSPEKCCLVPNKINEIYKNFNNYRKYNDNLPPGVTLRREKDRRTIGYRASTTILDEYELPTTVSKTFDNIFDAFCFYKQNKELYSKQMAEKYKFIIPKEVYNSMMNYKLITDYKFN